MSSHTFNRRFISPVYPSYSCERPVFLSSGPPFHETLATPRGSPAHHEAGEKPGSGSVCRGPRRRARCWSRHVAWPSAKCPAGTPSSPAPPSRPAPLAVLGAQPLSLAPREARPVGSPPRTVLVTDTHKHDFPAASHSAQRRGQKPHPVFGHRTWLLSQTLGRDTSSVPKW